MTNEQAKQKAIQEAWGQLYTNYPVDQDGWGKVSLYLIMDFPKHVFDYKSAGDIFFLVRPIALQGIDDNNGWTRIESEADLPKTSGRVEFITRKGNRTTYEFFCAPTLGDDRDMMKMFSHWRKEPDSPIY